MTHILSRLPVKSLLRFKCVSISFYNLISNDPLLKKKHLDHHRSSLKVLVPSHYTPRGEIETATNSCCVLSVTPDGDVHEEIIELDEFHVRIGLSRKRMSGHIYNSCDGLFCIGVDGVDVILWNPSTRQAKRLIPRGHPEDERGFFTCSLAHDSRSNVYKLLGVFRDNINRLRFYSTEMETWRCVEDSPPPCGDIMFNGDPAIVNGAFHWLCCHDFYYKHDVDQYFFKPHVVSLDICDETYGTLAMPKTLCAFSANLCVLKGKICVMCETKYEKSWEIWVMNVYGVADSVTRIFSFTRDDLPRFPCPLYTLDNIDIIKIYGIYIGTLSFRKDGRLLFDPVGGNKIERKAVPYAFFESLVSPHNCLENNVSMSTEIAANRFSATTSRDHNLHSHNCALPEKAFSRGKHVWAKRKHFLKRLCFCKNF